MSNTINLDGGSIALEVLSSARQGMMKAQEQFLVEAKRISPTDTRDYINSFYSVAPRTQNFELIGVVGNRSGHAQGVESGFRNKPVNRHKGPPRNESTRIYTGVGAKVQQRTASTISNILPRLLSG